MVLVTGGTGFVGREMVRQLSKAGYQIRLLVRNQQKASALARKYRCELVEGDILDPASLARAVKGVQAVIHLVGIIRETRKITFERAHMEGTGNLVEAMRHAGVSRLLYMSAAGTRPHARSRYHQTKWEGEKRVRQSGLEWTIFRPSLIYGAEDRSIRLMMKIIQLPFGLFPVWAGGKSRIQPIAVDEAAYSFVRAIGDPRTVGNVYDLCGPRSWQWREILAAMAKATGKSYQFDDWGVLALSRLIIWTLIFLLPLLIAVGITTGFAGQRAVVLLIVAWMGAVWLAWHWRTVLFFFIPSFFITGMEKFSEQFLPRFLQFGEQMKMLMEDNEGKPRSVEEAFGFMPKSFVEEILAHRSLYADGKQRRIS
jgi:NADH dehydrogenase